MSLKIEDYALIGNGVTVALVGKNGSIDWLAFPRYDSSACFAALVGSEQNGRWLIAPTAKKYKVTRRYRPGTLVLETEFSTRDGAAVVIDTMDYRPGKGDVLRLVRGLRGRVSFRLDLALRFEYGSVAPTISRDSEGRWRAVAANGQALLATPLPTDLKDARICAEFSVSEGEEIPFALTWAESTVDPPDSPDVKSCLDRITGTWEQWSSRFDSNTPWAEAVLRSLITVKALTHRQWGGVVAAATTSLPEKLGGNLNWDYRFCWLRDATFTLFAFASFGYEGEAKAWHAWLMRALAQSPEHLQIMYEVSGGRRLAEDVIPWLSGYEGSRPVLIGNAASQQLQLGVLGEVVDMLYHSYKSGLVKVEEVWEVEKKLLDQLEKIWMRPDEGIWELRSGPRQFTFSKVMVWAAFDRAIRTAEEYGIDGPVKKWRKFRTKIHNAVCRSGFDRWSNSFVQSFGSRHVDASLLLIPTVGFLPADDPRMLGTVKAIEKHLMNDGFVYRFKRAKWYDRLGKAEGSFLACNFWLVDNYILQNRLAEAHQLFERLLAIRNDVGLLSEEYDPKTKRLLGNFPQVFSHVALINTAYRFSRRQTSTGSARQ